ncbi:MAG: hypothetical protein GY869_09670, partial [Planctomycetes bacterium]|nr:hypothetical protein [Planctomycetota bacterium]
KSGANTSAGGEGKTTEQMQTKSTFTDAGWFFVDQNPANIWYMPAGGGYPKLYWQRDTLSPLPTFSGGSGSAHDPYQISTPDELNSIGSNPQLMNKHFILSNDIDLAGHNFNTIGSLGIPFSGSFDGNNHTILNVDYQVADQESVGLFGYVDHGVIKKLNVENITINVTNGKNTGGLVGKLSHSTIDQCHIQGHISGYRYVGGLVGWSTGSTVENCSSDCRVEGSMRVGGILGSAIGSPGTSCTIINSYAEGFVSGEDTVGGLVGSNAGPHIQCYSSGEVRGQLKVGGLIGSTNGDIFDCYTTAAVLGIDKVGGLIGKSTSADIFNCYSANQVTGVTSVGGFAGYTSSYGVHLKGPIYQKCFWDKSLNSVSIGIGNVDDPNVIKDSTPNLQKADTFTDKGWDFVNETANGTEDIWYIYENQSYPRLRWQNHIPIAHAGPDQITYTDLNTLARITINASASYDDNNDPLTYNWSWILNGQPHTSNGADGLINLHDFNQLALQWNNSGQDISAFAQTWLQNSTKTNYNPTYDIAPAGPILTLDLPIGTHSITLTVSDNIDLSEPDTVTITIYQSGDLDHNGQVNQNDLIPILQARNTLADDPNDPRDLNKDGTIDILDARLFVTRYLN